jgi:hypothetical protein
LVAIVILGSLDMFTSVLGTWFPFSMIFASTYLTGRVVRSRSQATRPTGGAAQTAAG